MTLDISMPSQPDMASDAVTVRMTTTKGRTKPPTRRNVNTSINATMASSAGTSTLRSPSEDSRNASLIAGPPVRWKT